MSRNFVYTYNRLKKKLKDEVDKLPNNIIESINNIIKGSKEDKIIQVTKEERFRLMKVKQIILNISLTLNNIKNKINEKRLYIISEIDKFITKLIIKENVKNEKEYISYSNRKMRRNR